MRIRLLAHLGTGLLLSASFSPLANAQDPDPCAMAARTQADINACSTQAYKAADAELNRSYKAVMAGLSKARAGKLKEAQRAWITYRDADCEAQSFDYTGGSLYTSMYNTCLSHLTQARVAELKRAYLQDSDASETVAGVSGFDLVGTWRALESSYGMEISFGIDAGVHHYLSRINSLPYEAGQWQLNQNQLSVIDNSGKVLHSYNRIQLKNDTLTLYEQDGSVEVYKKVPGAPK